MGLTESERKALEYVSDVVGGVWDYRDRLILFSEGFPGREEIELDIARFATVVDALVRLHVERRLSDGAD